MQLIMIVEDFKDRDQFLEHYDFMSIQNISVD